MHPTSSSTPENNILSFGTLVLASSPMPYYPNSVVNSLTSAPGCLYLPFAAYKTLQLPANPIPTVNTCTWMWLHVLNL